MTHTHIQTYVHAFMIYSHRKLLKVKRKALLRESKTERESKGEREGHPQERDSKSKHTLSICLSMCVCVCLCTHSYIISTYRTKRGTTTTKREQEKREREECFKNTTDSSKRVTVAQGQLKPALRQVMFSSPRACTACTTVPTVGDGKAPAKV